MKCEEEKRRKAAASLMWSSGSLYKINRHFPICGLAAAENISYSDGRLYRAKNSPHIPSEAAASV